MNSQEQKTILLVEDEAIIAMSEQISLENFGYKVIAVDSGEKAVEAVEKTPGIDLILMDINLGKGITGTQAAEIILEKNDLPVVFLSSHTEREIVEKTEGITSYGYIVKNAGETVLIASIKMAFRLFNAFRKDKEKEEALRESEAKYRSIVEQTVIGIGISAGSKIIFANNALLRIFNYDNFDEFKKISLTDHVAPSSHTLISDRLKIIAEGKIPPPEFECDILCKGGRKKTLRASSSHYSLGGVTYTQTAFQDITDRRQAEEYKHASEEFYRIISGVISDYIFSISVRPDGTLERNYSIGDVSKLLGYQTEGKDIVAEWDELVIPEDKPLYNEKIRKILNGETCKFEIRIRTKTSQLKYLEEYIVPVWDENEKRVTRIYGAFQDITERRQAGEELRKSQVRYQTLVENINEVIYSFDLTGKIVYISPAISRLSGYTPDELIGTGILSYVHPDDREETIKKTASTYSEKGASHELRIIDKSGEIRHVNASSRVIQENGMPVCITGLMIDITERKRTENLLEAERNLGIALAGTFSLDDVLGLCLSASMSVADMECGGIYLADESGGIFLAAHQGLSEAFVGTVSRYGADAPNTIMMMRGMPVYVDSTVIVEELEDEFNDRETILKTRNEGLKSIAMVPVRMADEMLACMNISSRRHVTIPTHARIALESIASHLGSAILRIRTQQAMRESEEKFRQFAAASGYGFAMGELTGRLTYANDAMLRIVEEKSDEDFSGKTFYEYYTPDDCERLNKDILPKVLEKGQWIGELPLITAQGNEIPTEQNIFLIHDERRNPRMLGNIITDITMRKWILGALQEREERFRLLFQNINSIFILYEVILDKTGRPCNYRFLELNSLFEKHTGIKASDLTGRTMLEVFPQTEHSWLDKFEEVYTTGIPTRFEEYSKVFETYIEVNIYAPQKGQLTVISSDITERKRVEVALQKSLTILNETGKIAKVGGWELDLATGIPTWTDETLLIFEIDRSKNPLLMLDGLNFYTPVSRQILEHALWRTIEYGEPYDLDLQAITTKGKHIWVHTIGKAERENGKTIRVSGFIHDITERKQAEDRIKALLGEKELLLKETHHRIKNNMSTLISLMSLQKKTIKEPAAVEALNDAGNRVRSMMVLYDKLYRSSVQEAISIKEYLPALIDEIISNFPCGIPLKIEKRVDAFVIDVKQLQPLGIIINELLTNMIKYAFTDRDSGLIIVSASLKDNIVSITIQDNGNCIPQSIDFENSPGFGLRLVGILTKQLEGTIRIERKNGTTIMLDFEKQK